MGENKSSSRPKERGILTDEHDPGPRLASWLADLPDFDENEIIESRMGRTGK